jgi:hypothetical protein
VALTERYLRIAGAAGLRPTLFVTGVAVEQDAASISRFAGIADCELGGHGYRALTPWLLHYGLIKRLTGSAWLGAGEQRRDIQKTVEAFKTRLGRAPTSWRTHSYAGNRDTPRLLKNSGLNALSDVRDPSALKPAADSSGILIVPINTLPDHESVRHPAQDASGPGTMSADGWLNAVTEQVDSVVRQGGLAVLLVHPVCMRLLDDFATFERLCAALRQYPSHQVSELT